MSETRKRYAACGRNVQIWGGHPSIIACQSERQAKMWADELNRAVDFGQQSANAGLVEALEGLLDGLRRCHKTDPKMDGGRQLRGIDHVQFELLVLPAISKAIAALGGAK